MTIEWIKFLIQFLESKNLNFERGRLYKELSSGAGSNSVSLKNFTDLFDSLSVEYLAAMISPEHLVDLSKDFLATVNIFNEEFICHVTKTKSGSLVIRSPNRQQYETSIDDFKNIWTGTVLLVDKVKLNWYNLFIKPSSLILATLLLVLIYGAYNLTKVNLFFLVVSIAGGVLGNHIFEISKDKNSKDSPLCSNNNNKNKCKIIQNNDVKILKLIPFSILPVSLFLGLSFSLLVNKGINKEILWFLLMLLPILLYSIWYQARMKMFCRVCLLASGLIIGFIAMLFVFLPDLSFQFNFNQLLVVLLSQMITLLIFFLLWKIDSQSYEFDMLNFKLGKFRSNKKLFKTIISENETLHIVKQSKDYQIGYGKQDSQGVVINAILNPFCIHCRNHFVAYSKLLKDKGEVIQLNFIFNTGSVDPASKEVQISLTIIDIYQKNKLLAYQALSDWFQLVNYDSWTKKYVYSKSVFAEECLREHNKWCANNKIFETPITIYNNSFFPTEYDITDISYLV